MLLGLGLTNLVFVYITGYGPIWFVSGTCPPPQPTDNYAWADADGHWAIYSVILLNLLSPDVTVFRSKMVTNAFVAAEGAYSDPQTPTGVRGGERKGQPE